MQNRQSVVDLASICFSQWGKVIIWCCKHLAAEAAPKKPHMEANAIKAALDMICVGSLLLLWVDYPK